MRRKVTSSPESKAEARRAAAAAREAGQPFAEDLVTGSELAKMAGIKSANATYYIARSGVDYVRECRTGNMIAKLYRVSDLDKLKAVYHPRPKERGTR